MFDPLSDAPLSKLPAQTILVRDKRGSVSTKQVKPRTRQVQSWTKQGLTGITKKVTVKEKAGTVRDKNRKRGIFKQTAKSHQIQSKHFVKLVRFYVISLSPIFLNMFLKCKIKLSVIVSL